MMFYKIIFVLEAEDYIEATRLTDRLIDDVGKYYDIWLKDIEDMDDDEILEFFERTREEMTEEDES